MNENETEIEQEQDAITTAAELNYTADAMERLVEQETRKVQRL